MTIEPIVFFDLIIAIVVLASVLGVIVVSYVRTIEKVKHLQKKESEIEDEANKKASDILGDAKIKAAKILENIHVSEDLIKKTFEEQLKKSSISSAQKIDSISQEFLKVYQKSLEDLKDNNIKTVSNISKDIVNDTRIELEDFKEILKKETIDSQKIVEGKIEQDYQTAEKDVETYKTEKLKKIEEEIYDIIQNVTKEVLGKSLSLQDHERLIIDSLEMAKKGGKL